MKFSIKFKRAKLQDLERIIVFRQEILHPGGPRERVVYSEDSDDSTLHLFLEKESRILACGSLIDEREGSFRIRGMAVSENLRGQGVGSELIDFFINHAKKNKAKVIWCNGRIKALGLYERKGFVKSGDVFDVPGSGPHFKLKLKLA